MVSSIQIFQHKISVEAHGIKNSPGFTIVHVLLYRRSIRIWLMDKPVKESRWQ